MIEYGTKEYWQEEIKQKKMQKEIFVFGVETMIKNGSMIKDFDCFIRVVNNFLKNTNVDIEYYKEKIKDAEDISK